MNKDFYEFIFCILTSMYGYELNSLMNLFNDFSFVVIDFCLDKE